MLSPEFGMYGPCNRSLRLLSDPELEFRFEVIKTLAQLGEPKVQKTLKHVAEHDPGLEVRAKALQALKPLADKHPIQVTEAFETRVDFVGGIDKGALKPIQGVLFEVRERMASDVHSTEQTGRTNPHATNLREIVSALKDTR